jgi:copper chaperone CopZ
MRKTIVLKFKGMTCNRRAERVRRTLEKELDVITTEVSLERRTAAVRFDPNQTTTDDILGSKVFNKDFTGKWTDGRRITHRYSAVLLKRGESGAERPIERDFGW